MFKMLALFCCLISTIFGQTPAPIKQRVSQLVSQMSLQEKADQLNSAHGTKSNTIYGMVDYADITSSCGSNITCRINSRNKFQESQINLSKYKIPVSFRSEALHSAAPMGTIFPVPSLLGCTWNTSLMQTIGSIIGYEARIFGVDFGFAPVLQVLTDPRFGRFTESYGGDPILVSHLGYYMSLGIKGGGNLSEYIDEYHINNEAKHFVGYAFGGKDGLPCDISERTLNEVYLRPWHAFVASGGGSVMASHNSVNGVPMHANYELLTNTLRNRYNWQDGLIASDCADISRLYVRGPPWTTLTGFHIAADMDDAVLKSLNAGMDLSLCDDIRTNVVSLINSNRLNESVLNRAVSNILHSKFAVGLFDNPIITNVSLDRINIINNLSSQLIAKEAALQGIVLLKNNNKLLPLDSSLIKSLAIIGPVANDQGAYYGPYANTGAKIITIVDALRDQYNFTLNIQSGCSAQNLSINSKLLNLAINATLVSDYVLLIVGDTLNTVGENHDRVDLELPGGQLYLINEILKIKELQTKTIVIYLGGRPGTFGTGLWNQFASIYSNGIGVRDNSLLNNINALLSAYHPGEQGGNALCDIIFGAISPSGRLSTSWPQSAAHVHSLHSPFLKPYQGHENQNYVYNTIDPLFPFGFGLSYADIIHDSKTYIIETIKNCEWKLTVNITNKSPIDSYEIIQIYYTKWISNVVRNELELAGFQKVFIPKYSTITATVIINADSLTYYSNTNKEWILESGLYYIYDAKNAKQFNGWSTNKINITQQVINPCKFWSNL